MAGVPTRDQRTDIRSQNADLMDDFQPTPAGDTRHAGEKPGEHEVVTQHAVTTPNTGTEPVNERTASGQEQSPNTSPAKKKKKRRKKRKKNPQSDGSDSQLTVHHIPPRRAGRYILKHVDQKHHRAYHMLFGNSATLEDCIAILRQHWWPELPPEGECADPASE